MRIHLTALLAALLLATAGCGDGGTSSGGGSGASTGGGDLEAAFCADLEGGMSLAQLASQAVNHFDDLGRDDPQASAAFFIEDAIDGCPEFRSDWEATLLYEEWIAPGNG